MCSPEQETRELGTTGVGVPVVGIGTWRVFDIDPEQEAQARSVVACALAGGSRLFDTSPMYGRAESVLARALGDDRARAFIATKIWASSAEKGHRQFERQMFLYGNRVELEQVHNLVSWREHLPWLEHERDAGRIGLIGVTHYESYAFDELCEAMCTRRIDVIQVPYNPLERAVEQRVLPLADELGIGVIAMRPFAERALLPGPPQSELSAVFDGTWTQALIKWILSDRRIHATIPASRRSDNIENNVAAGRSPWLDADQREHIGRLAIASQTS